MIQTRAQLLEISQEYNILFSKNEFYPVQKAYTTPHFICLGVRFPGRTVVIYIGRGHGYEGVFLHDRFPPSFLRIQDKFLDYLRKFLVGARIGKMEVDEKHFAWLFPYKNEHADNSFTFGYKEHRLFFINQSKENVFTSWNNQSMAENSIVKILDELLDGAATSSEIQKEWSLDKYLKAELEKANGVLVQKKKEKFLIRKISNIKKDLELVMRWPQMEKRMLKENFAIGDEREITFEGHRIKFPSGINEWQKRDLVFDKIKKLKKAEKILEQRLQESESELGGVGELEIAVTKEKAIPILWGSDGKAKGSTSQKFNILNFKLGAIHGAVGLDAISNDFLRSQGNKEHYWFHIENYTGAHCLLKTDDLSKITSVELSAIGSMLRDYSKLDILEVPMLYSQLKGVKGLKGVQGMVLIKKPKYLRVAYNGNWKEIITLVEA